MTIPHSVKDVPSSHVTLEVESLDRMYLNLYVPLLQTTAGVAWFWFRGYEFYLRH